MKKSGNTIFRYTSLPELHRMLGLPQPLHPLVTLIDNTQNALDASVLPAAHTSDFYKIAYKQNLSGKIRYGQQFYDFSDGGFSLSGLTRSLLKKRRTKTMPAIRLSCTPISFWAIRLRPK